jgi:hypothetical protein
MEWAKIVTSVLEEKRFPSALILISIVMWSVGAAGVWPYPSLQIHNPLALIALGFVPFTFGVLFYWLASGGPPKVTRVAQYKFKIAHPENGSVQNLSGGFFDMVGTYAKSPPEGYKMAIIEPIGGNAFAFRRDVELDQEHKRWHANAVWAGEARNRTKEFAIVMVSPAGKRLWDYWEKVGQEHNWDIPPIDKWPTEFFVCDTIRFVTA